MSKTIIGKVVSSSNDKSIILKIDRRKTHPLYRKKYTTSKTIAVHDPDNLASVGDLVEVQETKPISKSKRFALVAIKDKQKSIGDMK